MIKYEGERNSLRANRKYIVAVALLAVLAVVFGLAGTVAPVLESSSSESSSSDSVTHFVNPPTYDSGWVNITDKAGQYFSLMHGLNTTEVVVDIRGKQSLDPMGGALAWSRTYGGTSSEIAYSVVQTSDGGYVLAGDTSSFGAGGRDFWLVKTNSTGHMLWSQTYGGTDEDVAYSVVETLDGGYALAGRTHSFGPGWCNFWLVKTDSAGTMLWNQTYGTGDNSARSVVQTSDGGYALAGYSHGDFSLVKTDSAGTMLWDRTYGRPGRDGAYSMVQTSDGGYALAGVTTVYIAQDPWVWVGDAVVGADGEAVVGVNEVTFIARGTSFYLYYPPTDFLWERAAPPQPDGAAFKTGTALAWDGDDYIYALYGAATGDSRRWFYRYSISGNSWEALANTTADQGEGDAIAWVGLDNRIYATIGGEQRPTYFIRYDPSTNSWDDAAVADPPAGMGDGASLVWTGDNFLYALRGEFDETSPLYDFWRYDIVSDTWTAMADIPAYPQNGGEGGVGDGGSLLYIGLWVSNQTDFIYALSGNQVNEVPDNRTYRYTISTNSWERLADLPFKVGDYVGNRLAYAVQIYAWQGTPSTWEGGGDDVAAYGITHDDFWLVKTDTAGTLLWDKTYGGTEDDHAYSVVETSDGGYVLAGSTDSFGAGDRDFWLVKTNSTGHMLWDRTYGGTGWEVAYSVVQTLDGGYAIAGYTDSFGAGDRDFWLVKTDSAGNTLWNQTYGGTDDEEARSVVQTSDEGYALAGVTRISGVPYFWLVKVHAEMNLEHQRNLSTETGLAWTGLTNSTITLYRGTDDPYWNYVRVRIWLIKEPTWQYGDINQDGVVDIQDLYIVSRNYGKTFSLLSLTGIIAIAGIHTYKKRKQQK
jgi:hypothetical protein